MVNLKAFISKVADKFAGTTNPVTKQPIAGTGLQNLGAGAKSASVAVGATSLAKAPAVISGIAQATKSVASKAVSSFGKASLPTQAGIVIGGTIIAKSSRAKQQLSQAPSSFNQFTTNVANAYDNPSLENISQIGKDNPIISGLAVGGAVIGAGKGAGALASLLNTSAINKQTQTIKDTALGSAIPIIGEMKQPKEKIPKESILTSSENLPVSAGYPAPNTGVGYTNTEKSITKTKTKKRKTQNLNTRPINIRNNIMIANKNG